MIIAAKQLIGLRAETKSGQYLGRVRDFEIEAETLEIARFYVRPVGIIKGLVAGDLIIAKSSVLSLTAEKMTVLDLVGSELAVNNERARKIVIENSPVAAAEIK